MKSQFVKKEIVHISTKIVIFLGCENQLFPKMIHINKRPNQENIRFYPLLKSQSIVALLIKSHSCQEISLLM